MITPKITNLGYSNLWTDMSTILGYTSNFAQQIQKLFANGEQGFFYDPNDLSTMFQDAAGTIPITAAGQLVGLIRDKSGRNNHAYQTVSASRPLLQRNATTGAYYLTFDGFDDFLVTNNIDFTLTDKVSLFAGVRKYVNSSRILCELSSSMNVNPNSFYMTAPENAAGAYGFKSRGSAGSNTVMSALTQPTSTEDSCVLVASADISADSNTISRNGILSATSNELGSGNYGNYPLFVGRRGGKSFPFKGHLYSLIGIGRLTADSETIALEKAIAKNVGVTLNV